MTNQHPITPPPELVQQWLGTYFGTTLTGEVSKVELALATQAARWGADQQLKLDAEQITQAYQAGADQELDACCHEVQNMYSGGRRLRDRRRPKPPSLKELALAELEEIIKNPQSPLRSDTETIRRAIEALPK